MTDKEKVKAIIKQYADKGERLLEEAYENGEHASTTGYWDGFGDCANLLLIELDDMQEEPTIPNIVDEHFWEMLGEESVSEDLEEAVNAYIGYAPEVDESSSTYGKRQAFEAGAKWKEQQLVANAVDGFVIEDIEEGNGDFLLSAEYLSKDMGLKDRQKVKVIVIRED